MRRVYRAVALWAACGAVLLAGCSGAGVPTAEVRQQSVQSFAANHLAALVLVKGWVAALRSDPGFGGDCEPEGDWEITKDGYYHVWGTNTDCSTYDFVDRGGVGDGTWVLADGRQVGVSWEVLEESWDSVRERTIKEFADGARLEVFTTTDFSEGLSATMEGTLTLPDGRAMSFVARQEAGSEEAVTMTLPDGSSCEYTMPLVTVGFDGFVPGYEDGMDGLYTAANGQQLAFRASGSVDGIDTWQVQADGLSGEFSIGDQFAGDGAVTRDGRIAAALDWEAPAEATVDLLEAGKAEVGPSGAALDFAVDQWIDNAAALGPMPIY